MIFYEVIYGEQTKSFHRSLVDAHKAAKACANRESVFIEEFELSTDKDTIVALLNCTTTDWENFPVQHVNNVYRLTPRGGLRLLSAKDKE